MSRINPSTLEVLQGKTIYNTYEEDYVLSEDYADVINEPSFKILGFLNDYLYVYNSGYLSKRTLNNIRIVDILLDVEHGSFFEGLNLMYFYKDKELYCIDESLNILWNHTFEDHIRDIYVDAIGNCYIIFKHGRNIEKYSSNGEFIFYINNGIIPNGVYRLYNVFVSRGCYYMYTLGTEFHDDNTVDVIIDIYNLNTYELIDRKYVDIFRGCACNGIDDSSFEFISMIVGDSYIHISIPDNIFRLTKNGYMITASNPGLNFEYFDFNPEKESYVTDGNTMLRLDSHLSYIWGFDLFVPDEYIDDLSIGFYKNKIYISQTGAVDASKWYSQSSYSNLGRLLGFYTDENNEKQYFPILYTAPNNNEENGSLSLITINGSNLITIDGDYINTIQSYGNASQDSNVINGYIYADKFKFARVLVSKQNRYKILTKKLKRHIAVKKPHVYMYKLYRLQEINTLVEYLLENNYEIYDIGKYIEDLIHNTSHMIKSMQIATCPSIYDIKPFHKYLYKYDGKEYQVSQSNTQIYMCANIPYIKKRDFKSIYIDSMANLVESGDVIPFMLFIGGRAIRWSDITIVRDWEYSYIILSNVIDTTYKLECILFPCTIRYGEDSNILPICDAYMYFDKNGKITEDKNNIAIRIEAIDSRIIGEDPDIVDGYFTLSELPSNLLSNYNNLIPFNDGLLYTDGISELSYLDMNTFQILSTNNISSIKAFYNTKANDTKNIISKIKEDAIEEAKSNISNGNLSDLDWIYRAISDFDFDMYKNKTYEKNISEIIAYILKFDASLLTRYFINRDRSFESIEYTGKYMIDNSVSGVFTIPRQNHANPDDYVMVFVNGKLDDLNVSISYNNNDISIPIGSLLETDNVEIVKFKNAYNDTYSITLSDDLVYIPEELRDDFTLFSTMSNIVYFLFENVYENEKYIGTRITLEDESYIGQELQLVSFNRFAYRRFQGSTNNLYDLGDNFKYCTYYDRYMVFINGEKVSSDSITIFVSESNIELYIDNTSTDESDIIDIYYIPISYIQLNSDMNNDVSIIGNGVDIIIPYDNLSSIINSELSFVFNGGLKIRPSKIDNISPNRIRAYIDITNIHDISILEFESKGFNLIDIFGYDKWTEFLSSLTEDEYLNLITDTTR